PGNTRWRTPTSLQLAGPDGQTWVNSGLLGTIRRRASARRTGCGQLHRASVAVHSPDASRATAPAPNSGRTDVSAASVTSTAGSCPKSPRAPVTTTGTIPSEKIASSLLADLKVDIASSVGPVP